MSLLLEIVGKAIAVDVSELIRHWLDMVTGDGGRGEQLSEVIELMCAKKYESAEKQLRVYVYENPECPRGRMAGAAICLQKNQLLKAVHQLEAVYTRQPGNTMALYALGHCYERLGKESEAIEFYQDCLKFKNYLRLPRQRLAAIYFKNCQLEKTIVEYQQLKNEYPDDLSILTTLGYLQIAAGEYEIASQEFNTAILIHPDNFQSDEGIDQLIREGRIYEALEQTDSLLVEYPERADLVLKKADILGLLGNVEASVDSYRDAIKVCPDFLEANIKLGTQYLRCGQKIEAAMQFNRAAEINEQIVDAYIGLAIAMKLENKVSEAKSTLSLAAAILPNSALLFAQTATLQFEAGLGRDWFSDNVSEPVSIIESVIEAHSCQISSQPQNPELHYRMGILMMSVGNGKEAAKAFEAALEINPTYARARSKLVICLFETSREREAMKKLTGPDCLQAGSLELHYKTALLYCDRIKFASSLINLEHYIRNNFADVETTSHIAIVLQNLGLLDRVTAMWDNLSETTSHAMDLKD